MTKKLIAALLAVSVLLTACVFVLAEETSGEPAGEPAAIVVTLDANSGTGEMEALTPVDGKVTAPECTFTKENFKFEQWNTAADASGERYVAGDEIAVTESITLYAIWTKDDLTWWEVTYDANGGEGVTEDSFNPYLDNTEAMAVYNEFTNGDKTFKEWNTAADGSGTAYQPDDTFVITSNVTLYAIWEGGAQEPASDVEEPSDVTPPAEEPSDVAPPVVEDVTPDTVTDTNTNPETGDSVAATVAMGAAIVALGALVVLKKKN